MFFRIIEAKRCGNPNHIYKIKSTFISINPIKAKELKKSINVANIKMFIEID